MAEQDILLIRAEGKTMLALMNKRSCLGYSPRIIFMTLYPKDLNLKHDYVEQRGLGCMNETMKEMKLVEFFVRARRKDEGGNRVSLILKHLICASSTKDLHHGVSDERSLNTSSKEVFGENYAGRYPNGIVEFFRYAMAIYDIHLMKDKLEKVGCTHEEVEVVQKYLRMQYQSDTWVD